MESIIALLILISPIVFIVLLVKAKKKQKNIEKEFNDFKEKYSSVIDVVDESERIKKESEEIKVDYMAKKKVYDELNQQIRIYTENLELIEVGFYEPIFDFDTSEKYKDEIIAIRKKQKDMISNKTAIYCNTSWEVEGSKSKGQAMTNRNIRITARAFNNECDVLIDKVKWNNVDKMLQRLDKAYETINKLNESTHVIISKEYLKLKQDELHLAYEYQRKKQQEKEEQAEIKERIREEAKLEKEMQKAQKDEEQYLKLLEKAKTDAEKSTGDKLDKLKEQIKKLELEVKEAHEKNERAISMAQQTKSGFVYVISNIGSFGENIYKIGMTRRLEPLDRVRELGDASVPFIFDVHAMIYSENAPMLENQLHKVFDEKRVNLVNTRKEFFNVSLSEIKDEVYKIDKDTEFIETIQAQEYRESLSIRESRKEQKSKQKEQNKFPDSF